jgi:alkylation response protein AidB-like acyl-CoA dehydrogenase
MPRLAQTAGLTDVQQEILATVKQFVDKEIIPHAQALEHADEYPADIVAGMREMGLFGLTIPEEYGGLGESLLTYALVVEQIARGWMSVSGIINTHFIVAHMIKQHGTPEQKRKFLPAMAVGEVRGSFSMSEPDLGSDVAAITTKAVRDPGNNAYVVNGAKMWLTNGGSSTLIALLARTDEGAARAHQNLTAFLVEKPAGFGEVLPGLTIPGKIDKMGYKGVDTTEALFDNVALPADSVLGGQPGRGFAQMMDGIEVGRVNVSARACGIAIRAFELAVGYAQTRKTFGRAIAEHQAIAFKLAEMATKVEAAHLMMVNAARLKDSGERNDVAAGMAKLLASEYCAEVTQDAFRIHGGYGYSTEYEIERLMREAPFLLIGEGTSEIQKMIISRGLLREYKILKSIVPNGPGRLCFRPFPWSAKVSGQAGGPADQARSTKIRCRSLAASGGEPAPVR